MDIFPKFIIEDGSLILGKVTYHKDLVTDKEKVKGGGFFHFDKETATFCFYGRSNDYGKASMEDIKKCIADDLVFSNKYSNNSVATVFDFNYKDDLGRVMVIKSNTPTL